MSNVKQLLLKTETYRGFHRAPLHNNNDAPLYNLTLNGIFPTDVYGPRGVRIYGMNHEINQQKTFDILRRVKDKPNAMVTIYRAAPLSVTEIHDGDWVAINKEYAQDHGESHLDDYHILEKKVYAYQVYNDGNSIEEYGYNQFAQAQ